jgi:hypothetical protein
MDAKLKPRMDANKGRELKTKTLSHRWTSHSPAPPGRQLVHLWFVFVLVRVYSRPLFASIRGSSFWLGFGFDGPWLG